MSEDNKTCVAEDMGGEAADLEAVGGEAADLKAKVVGKELPSQPLPSNTGVLLKNKLPSQPLPSNTSSLAKNIESDVRMDIPEARDSMTYNLSTVSDEKLDQAADVIPIGQFLLWDWIEDALRNGNQRQTQIEAQKWRKRQGRRLGIDIPEARDSMTYNLSTVSDEKLDQAADVIPIGQFLLWDWIEDALRNGNQRQTQIEAQKSRKRQGRRLGKGRLNQSRRDIVF